MRPVTQQRLCDKKNPKTAFLRIGKNLEHTFFVNIPTPARRFIIIMPSQVKFLFSIMEISRLFQSSYWDRYKSHVPCIHNFYPILSFFSLILLRLIVGKRSFRKPVL